MNIRVTRALVVLLVAGSGLLLSGCSRLGAMSRVDPISVAVYPGGQGRQDPVQTRTDRICRLIEGANSFSRGAIDLGCFVFPEDAHQRNPQLAYARAFDNQFYRNRLASLLLKHSDDVCVEEMGRMTSYEATTNTSLSVTGTVLGTIANIVTGQRAAEILTGGATIAGASRDHVNAHVYRNQVSYAISRAITIERDRLRDALQRRFSESSKDFTVDDAIREVNAYHGTCSFYRGLELVIAAVSERENLQRHQTAVERQNESDRITREIALLQREMQIAPGQADSYQSRIDDLLDQRSALARGEAPTATAGTTATTSTPDTTTTAPGTDQSKPRDETPATGETPAGGVTTTDGVTATDGVTTTEGDPEAPVDTDGTPPGTH